MSFYRLGSRLTQSRKTVSANHPIPDLGGIFVSDTAERTAAEPKWFMQIQCLTDAVIDIANSNVAVLGANLSNTATAVSLKAGTTIYGVFPRFKLASGTVMAYYGTD